MWKYTCLALAVLVLIGAVPSAHAIPQLINYQGILTDAGGTPITVATNVEFRIWDMDPGGTELWMETQSVTPDANGSFSVLLGSTNPIPDSAFDVATAYLGTAVVGDPELSPRFQLVAVAYAFRVGTVDGATGGNITTALSVGTGHTNTGAAAFVAGRNNNARGNFSVVSGGGGPTAPDSNSASGEASTVGGGRANTAVGFRSTVSGGDGNLASGVRASVGGGLNNVASGQDATIGGGSSNTASGSQSTVGGGVLNNASQLRATVGGGAVNAAGGSVATIGGGNSNSANGDGSTIAGGERNEADGQNATVAGGADDTANGDFATVAGGSSNSASGSNATVGGGALNIASGIASTIAGGGTNTTSGITSTISGGRTNIASGDVSVIGGGEHNRASAIYSTVCGGGGASTTDSNSASGQYSAVGGGRANRAGGFYSTVSGGRDNFATGSYSAVGGGRNNRASAEQTLAAGAHAKAGRPGSIVISATRSNSISDSVWSNGAEQMVLRADSGLYLTNSGGAASIPVGRLLNTSTNAHLTTGGVWTNASDLNQKENFEAVNSGELLDKIAQLSIERWNYKDEDPAVRHIGPVAQEFYALFGVGADEKTISTIDPAGIALAAIQELHQRNQNLEELVLELYVANGALNERLSQLENNK